jgi:hypothetical protein
MEAWLAAHAIKAVDRPAWLDAGPGVEADAPPESLDDGPKSSSGRRTRNAEALRQHLKELGDVLGPRDLDMVVTFAEFLKARRAARSFAHHHEHMLHERTPPASGDPPPSSGKDEDA